MTSTGSDAFTTFAESYRPHIEEQLRRYADYDADCPTRLRDAIQHSLLAPGKRLRPLLVLLSADICGIEPRAAMPAACAIEMIHTYSLIHDDLPAMDDDDLRRGRPSCHAAFDEATAILAGDALLTQAFEVLACDLRPSEIAVRCAVELARAAGALGMVGGQADDLASENQLGTAEFLQHIHRRKTGALLTAALRLGGIIGNGSDEQLQRLTAYGTRIGLAFQIVDDLLDAEGEQVTIGKRTGQDEARGKLTFPALLGIDESRTRATSLIESAIEQLEPFGSRGDHLQALARFILERKR